nr:MAG TPA: hypothetical protein [Caudoviricetes sp.]
MCFYEICVSLSNFKLFHFFVLLCASFVLYKTIIYLYKNFVNSFLFF